MNTRAQRIEACENWPPDWTHSPDSHVARRATTHMNVSLGDVIVNADDVAVSDVSFD